jgi:DNA-binding transcriptional LysR family regulator
MELRHLRYFVAVGEEEHFGRAALRLRVAQPALSRQIQDLEREIGFQLFDRLSRGVKISSAGRLFLEEARRILQQLNEATERAQRVARGQSGTLRVGFTENASWRGVVPDSLHLFRERYPDAELQLNPLPSLQQLEAVRSGRLDAGFMFNPPKPDRELDQLPVAVNSLALAAPAAHPLGKVKNLRLRDMTEARFIWFPRRESAAFYDRLMYECFRGGLKSPRIVQEASNEATILTLVAQGMGVGFVVETARWRCPDGVAILRVADLKLSLPLALVWRKDNLSPLLSRFVTDVGSVVKRRLTTRHNGQLRNRVSSSTLADAQIHIEPDETVQNEPPSSGILDEPSSKLGPNGGAVGWRAGGAPGRLGGGVMRPAGEARHTCGSAHGAVDRMWS